ncbi:MAG: hypothetical protein WCG85_05040, partial [Polyangia bacterium]
MNHPQWFVSVDSYPVVVLQEENYGRVPQLRRDPRVVDKKVCRLLLPCGGCKLGNDLQECM